MVLKCDQNYKHLHITLIPCLFFLYLYFDLLVEVGITVIKKMSKPFSHIKSTSFLLSGAFIDSGQVYHFRYIFLCRMSNIVDAPLYDSDLNKENRQYDIG